MKRYWAWWVLLAILSIGGYLRLSHLGSGTMGSDVMEYYKICQSGVRPGELMLNSQKYVGEVPPFWFAVHNWFIQTFRLEVTFGTVRLPDSLFGILTILAAFGAGRAARCSRVGLLTALFVALQPLHIQMSRECYFYSAIVLGCFLGMWGLLRLANRVERGEAPDAAFYALLLTGFLLLTFIQVSSWSFAAVLVLAVYAILLPAAMRKQIAPRHVVGLTAGLFLVGLPVLLSSWGLRYAFSLMFGERGAHWGEVFGEQDRQLWLTAWHMISAYLVGRGGLRTIASVFLLLAGVATFAKGLKQERKLRVFAAFALGTFGLLALLHTKSIFPTENRHYSSLFPILAVGVGLGLVRWSEAAVKSIRSPAVRQGAALGGPAILLAALNAVPARLSVQQDWSPPWSTISAWADTQLPPGTIVLCDRWFTPWNEFRMNPSTNVIYTFTVPSEPVKTYTDNRWRETAKEFIAINPLAAFFEQKSLWERLGPWTWPQDHFARKQVFEDKAAARLDQMGLYYRARAMDYPREWIPVTIYYNTADDLLARAQNAGDRLLCLFGSGWEYTKTQDYRDWYALKDTATLIVHNLTSAPTSAYLNVVGAATPVSVAITAYAGANAEFPPNQIQSQRLGPVQLAPGRNEIRLGNLNRIQPPASLLVQRITASEN